MEPSIFFRLNIFLEVERSGEMRPDPHKQAASRKYQAKQATKGSSTAVSNKSPASLNNLDSNAWRYKEDENDAEVDIAAETRQLQNRIKQTSLDFAGNRYHNNSINGNNKDSGDKAQLLDLDRLEVSFRALFKAARMDLQSVFRKIDPVQRSADLDISILLESSSDIANDIEKTPQNNVAQEQETAVSSSAVDEGPNVVDQSKPQQQTHEELEEWLDDILG